MKYFTLLLLLFSGLTQAQDVQNARIFYGGVGSNSEEFAPSAAWSIGGIFFTETYLWGADLAGEGYSLDSTYGQNEATESALSLNLLWGKQISRNFSLLGLIGVRDETSECQQQSFLGFQCYADEDPEVSYTVNYGVHAIYTVSSYQLFRKEFSLGLRVTGESTQLTLGFTY